MGAAAHAGAADQGCDEAVAARGPSFNCVYARTPDEVLICQNEQLSKYDRELAYSKLNDYHFGLNDFFRITQVDWLNRRYACGYTYKCIEEAYWDRLSFFTGDVDPGIFSFCKRHRGDPDCIAWTRNADGM